MTHFNWTIDRLEEILKNEKTDYYRDAALQRFSFTCDMAFKCIRSLAVDQGKSCENFQQCVIWAVEKNWVEKKEPWKEMTVSYDRAAQKLKGELADLEYEKLKSYCGLLKNIYVHLKDLWFFNFFNTFPSIHFQ